MIERGLMAEVERAECGELSDSDRIALADKLADAGMDYLRRAQRLSKLAMKVRAGHW